MNGKVRYIEVKHYHQLVEPYVVQTSLRPMKHIATDYAILGTDGVLIIDKGFSWDGASGPAIDTKSIIRASLVHDVLYRLMREGLISLKWRQAADKDFKRLYQEDATGWRKLVSPIRSWWLFRGVRDFGRSSAVRCEPVVLEAP